MCRCITANLNALAGIMLMPNSRCFHSIMRWITVGILSAVVLPVRVVADKPPAAFSKYEPALELIADDLNVLSAKSQLLIVWILDESQSMVDDRQVMSKSLAQFQNRLTGDPVSVVVGFGKSVNVTTRKPTSDIDELRDAFGRVRPNSNGEENFCRAVAQSVTEFGKIASRQKRRIVVIAATDESPSDAGDFDPVPNSGLLEQAVSVCKRHDAPVFVLGREAVFGAPHARLRWIDPVYKLVHWIPIDRGPDAAGQERLLWNGLQRIQPMTPSGFGPYSQSRFCSQTGGRFIMLSEFPRRVPFEQSLKAMQGYEPELVSRREYEVAVQKSPLRAACRQIIQMLNPQTDKKLILPTTFPKEVDTIRKSSLEASRKAAHIRDRLETSIALLRSLQNQRDAATSKRTQANYDLLLADCLTARVRLTEYLAALDSFAVEPTDVIVKKHNRGTSSRQNFFERCPIRRLAEFQRHTAWMLIPLRFER